MGSFLSRELLIETDPLNAPQHHPKVPILGKKMTKMTFLAMVGHINFIKVINLKWGFHLEKKVYKLISIFFSRGAGYMSLVGLPGGGGGG